MSQLQVTFAMEDGNEGFKTAFNKVIDAKYKREIKSLPK